MCTIGNSFYKLNGTTMQSVFKQCDLVSKTTFLTPYVKTTTSDKGTKYVAFTREKGEECPSWAGVNEYGVNFVAADSYMDKQGLTQNILRGSDQASVFDMYLKIITDFTTAEDAVKMAKKFYETQNYGSPLTDILMICDEKETFFIETYNKEVRILRRHQGHFASTNHCRMVYGAITYEQNHSTYLRLERAEQILQIKSDLEGIGNVLRDSYYGESVWSICRYPYTSDAEIGEINQLKDEELYYTQAAVIFTIKPNEVAGMKPHVICEYVINNNPSVLNAGFKWKPFESQGPIAVPYIGKIENLA